MRTTSNHTPAGNDRLRSRFGWIRRIIPASFSWQKINDQDAKEAKTEPKNTAQAFPHTNGKPQAEIHG
ncbi:MAG TPA: hypothetical protein VK970_08775 [Candidatus Methylacidiphilales bacterium]|nr:hypothetical protein [Candidatus Methylacidiphilales bacterium]